MALVDIAQGLLVRSWAVKAAITADSADPPPGQRKYSCLQREDLLKIRKKLESSFPTVPDLGKVSGH
jgi:hypothetical protein